MTVANLSGLIVVDDDGFADPLPGIRIGNLPVDAPHRQGRPRQIRALLDNGLQPNHVFAGVRLAIPFVIEKR